MPIINNSSLKRKAEDSDPRTDERDLSQISIQELLLSFNNEITKRLDKIDQRLDIITETCDGLEGKIEQITAVLNNREEAVSNDLNSDSSGLSSGMPYSSVIPFNSGVTVITLNNADAFPDGSWLGDEGKPELRVRCSISPSQLLYINTTCATPEKMALVLLDHLFDREIQACSNISGMGKYKKDRLDPLLIYGIQCHLISQFRITEDDWLRIKQNIDSKCRTAFHKKRKSLTSPKSSPSNLQSTQNSNDFTSLSELTKPSVPSSSDDASVETIDKMEAKVLVTTTETTTVISQVVEETEERELKTEDIQLVHATPEQLAEIERTHKIQILPGGHILATPLCDNSEQALNSD